MLKEVWTGFMLLGAFFIRVEDPVSMQSKEFWVTQETKVDSICK